MRTVWVAIILAAASTIATAGGRERPWRAAAEGDPVAATGKQQLTYGRHRLQRVDFWPAVRPGAALLVYVHGGGWKRGDKGMMDGSAKLRHWLSRGHAVASVNYRLVPEASVEQQAADIAAALAYLRTHARRLGFDAGRIVLVGHSAGAHLVALLGTDPHYLQGAGLALADIGGVVALDGACYDVPSQMRETAPLMHGTYLQAFGADPTRQQQLSPVTHAAAPNVAWFLVLHVQRRDGTAQSRLLADALQRAGTPVSVHGLDGRGMRGHAEINRRLGEPDYPATELVDAFLDRVVGETSRH